MVPPADCRGTLLRHKMGCESWSAPTEGGSPAFPALPGYWENASPAISPGCCPVPSAAGGVRYDERCVDGMPGARHAVQLRRYGRALSSRWFGTGSPAPVDDPHAHPITEELEDKRTFFPQRQEDSKHDEKSCSCTCSSATSAWFMYIQMGLCPNISATTNLNPRGS
jgi:hypothetical protein